MHYSSFCSMGGPLIAPNQAIPNFLTDVRLLNDEILMKKVKIVKKIKKMK